MGQAFRLVNKHSGLLNILDPRRKIPENLHIEVIKTETSFKTVITYKIIQRISIEAEVDMYVLQIEIETINNKCRRSTKSIKGYSYLFCQ